MPFSRSTKYHGKIVMRVEKLNDRKQPVYPMKEEGFRNHNHTENFFITKDIYLSQVWWCQGDHSALGALGRRILFEHSLGKLVRPSLKMKNKNRNKKQKQKQGAGM